MPNEHPHKLLRSVGGEGTGVIGTTFAARIRAFRDILSEDEADDRLRRQEIAERTKSPWKLTSVIFVMMTWTALSDFLVFWLTCEGPASATVCAAQA